MGVIERLDGSQARLFVGEEDLETLQLEVGGGEVAVCSRRSPAGVSPNEDAATIVTTGAEATVLAVADGLGGARAGEHASAKAVQCLVDSVRNAVSAGRDLRAGILDGFERANQQVRALGVGAATTLAVAELKGGAVRAYHVGDSFVLLTGNRGRVKLQTISHSPVGYGVESGLLDPEDAMHHQERHFVSNFIGSSDMHIEVGSPVELSPHDTLLLGSDGLSDNLHLEEIVACIRKGPLELASRELARRARARMESSEASAPSKPDDLTFVLYRPRNASSNRRRNEGGSMEGKR